MSSTSDKFLELLKKASTLLILLGVLSFALGLSSPPVINPLPGSHIYLRVVGVLLFGLGIIFELKERWPAFRRWWLPLVATFALAVGAAFIPLAPGGASQSDIPPDLPQLLLALATRVTRLEVGATAVASRLPAPTAPPIPEEVPGATEPPPAEPPESDPCADAPPGMVFVPGGSFLMGSDALGPASDSYPQHPASASDFCIHAHEVSNSEYQSCVDAGECSAPARTSSITHPQYFINPEFAQYPVIYVSFAQAYAYCQWIGASLPTEEQWEKAARGTQGRTYPWGEADPEPGTSNLALPGVPTDVVRPGSYPDDVSIYGIFDMAGNVSEWTSSWYASYDGNPNPFDYTNILRVLRGASFAHPLDTQYPKVYFRQEFDPEAQRPFMGFRCAWSP